MYRSLNGWAIGIKVPFEEMVNFAKEGGFEGVEIDPREVAQLGVEKANALLSAAGILASSCGVPVNWKGEEEEYRQHLKELPGLAEIAAGVGCKRMITFIWPSSDTMTFRENFRFHVNRLRPIAEILAEKGCRFGLEFLGPWTIRKDAHCEFIHNMDGMLALCAALGTDNMGLLLDCWHWHTAGGRVEQIRKLRDEDIVTVHINDAPAGIPMEAQIDTVRCLPGETGVIDISGFLGALKEIGYSGPVIVEPFSQRLKSLPPKEALRETAAALNRVWKW